jgi:hypothetical protein
MKANAFVLTKKNMLLNTEQNILKIHDIWIKILLAK